MSEDNGIVRVMNVADAIAEMWNEGQVLERKGPATPAELREVELMAAGDLVRIARDIDFQARDWCDATRAAFELRFSTLAHELTKATEKLAKMREDRDYIPPFIRASAPESMRPSSLRVVK